MGKELSLSGAYTDPTVVLSADTIREFPYGGVNFSYPAYFTWEAEIENDGYKCWTLSGNDAKLLFLTFTNP